MLGHQFKKAPQDVDCDRYIRNGDRLALIRKPHFEAGIWRPPGGGVKRGEDFVAGVQREAFEETGLRIELQRYLVAATARFVYEPYEVPWRTHIFSATTEEERLEPHDAKEIEDARWGTLAELSGPLRERLLATGRAFWRYRVALHDAAADALSRGARAPAAPR